MIENVEKCISEVQLKISLLKQQLNANLILVSERGEVYFHSSAFDISSNNKPENKDLGL